MTFLARLGLGVAISGLAGAPMRADLTLHSIAGPGLRGLAGVAGQALASGQTVWVGTFANGFDIGANAQDLVALGGAWHPFQATVVRNILGSEGRFAATGFSRDQAMAGRQVVWWVFETRDGTPPWRDFGNVLGYALFTSTAPNWRFPAADALPPANTQIVTSSEVDVAYHGSWDEGGLRLGAVSGATGLRLGAWRRAWFGNDDSLLAAADGADPDADGVANLAEYGLGTNPLVADAQPVRVRVETDAEQPCLVLRLNWRKDRPEVQIGIRSSPDLLNWSEASTMARRIVAETAVDQTIDLWLPATNAAGFFQVQFRRAGAGGWSR